MYQPNLKMKKIRASESGKSWINPIQCFFGIDTFSFPFSLHVCVEERERKRVGEVEIFSSDQELEKELVKKSVKIDIGVGVCEWMRKNKKKKKERKSVWMKKILKIGRKSNIKNKKSKLSNITMIFS